MARLSALEDKLVRWCLKKPSLFIRNIQFLFQRMCNFSGHGKNKKPGDYFVVHSSKPFLSHAFGFLMESMTAGCVCLLGTWGRGSSGRLEISRLRCPESPSLEMLKPNQSRSSASGPSWPFPAPAVLWARGYCQGKTTLLPSPCGSREGFSMLSDMHCPEPQWQNVFPFHLPK